ncbi:methyltransferase domain-containing protein [Phyllosticta citrichinensis]|uniref:Methyltransferase domain-containing protein n=1 Tax=Phyllosticta citrichinensis TaxID=1130410 RepID=A0ABR1Y3C6_9PEZI
MLPTPSTSHVSFDRVYEPAEDSYLLLDTLSSDDETNFLSKRFDKRNGHCGSPLVVEVGTGSGVVLAFVAQNTDVLFKRNDVLTLGIDISAFACHATSQTVATAIQETRSRKSHPSVFLDAVNADLLSPLRPGVVDILIFNPPYVPTPALPDATKHDEYNQFAHKTSFDQDSYLLKLSYAGGADGMETTNRLLEQLPSILHAQRGMAYVLLCAQNKPREVQARVRSWGTDWDAEFVGSSGKTAGWEKLQILRVWRRQRLE